MNPASLPAPAGPLAAYPRWLLVAGATVLAVALIWIFSKLLKWALWLLMIAVLIGGGILAVRLWLAA